jgi:hypothetical protein
VYGVNRGMMIEEWCMHMSFVVWTFWQKVFHLVILYSDYLFFITMSRVLYDVVHHICAIGEYFYTSCLIAYSEVLFQIKSCKALKTIKFRKIKNNTTKDMCIHHSSIIIPLLTPYTQTIPHYTIHVYLVTLNVSRTVYHCLVYWFMF